MMKLFSSLLALCLLSATWAFGQQGFLKSDQGKSDQRIPRQARTEGLEELPFDANLYPFYHGVASGDPLEDAVIIWTRVTPENGEASIAVNWYVATDVKMANIVQQGQFTTDADRDYTVKVDVTGLNAGTTYYYGFEALDHSSLIGRTKTLPASSVDHLKFAVVSCSNYEAGYFNAYRAIGERNDLDAVLHLGDYIYEYGVFEYGIDDELRQNQPEDEIVSLADYRMRYSLYRLDPDLRRAHQQHPFISVWDDHESANDAYKDGAENHTEGEEGTWTDRKAISRQVYAEWMPIRGEAQQIYRSMRYGDLVDLIMIDTRLEGRTKQPFSIVDPDFNDYRTLLGEEQFAWFTEQLKSSDAKWKVVGNQVIFAQLNVGFAAGFADGQPDITNLDSIVVVESGFVDIWDGYPAERQAIMDSIIAHDIDNVVFLTGDFHSTFAFDVTPQPTIYPNPQAFNLPTPSPTYNPENGSGAIAVEFATPSITSANFDENVDLATATTFQLSINGGIPVPGVGEVFYNPHMKYADLIRHGYFILDLKPDSAQANWYFVQTILEPNPTEFYAQGWYTKDGENHLNKAAQASAPKAQQDDPTPTTPPASITGLVQDHSVAVLSLFPNPAQDQLNLIYALRQAGDVSIQIVSADGSEQQAALRQTGLAADIHGISLSVSDLPNGIYLIKVTANGRTAIRRFAVSR